MQGFPRSARRRHSRRAVSVANSAVEVLRTDTDVPARSVAAELWQWSQDRERLGPRDLLIIDEASTLGTGWGRDLMREAQTRGAVVVLLGDHRQFQAVAYGNALGAAQAIEPGIDMQTTMRQKTEWQARATEELRAGRIRAGLDSYNRNGSFTTTRRRPQPARGSSRSGRRSSAAASIATRSSAASRRSPTPSASS